MANRLFARSTVTGDEESIMSDKFRKKKRKKRFEKIDGKNIKKKEWQDRGRKDNGAVLILDKSIRQPLQ